MRGFFNTSKKITKVLVSVTIILTLIQNSNVLKASDLYLLGDATEAGWDNTAALEMVEISNGIFQISANINGTGEWIKFIEVLGQWAPQYGTDDAGTSSSGNLVYRPTESDPDPMAIPAPQEAGIYTIVANINELTYTVTAGSTEGLIVTDPVIPTDNNPVTITFDATQGSGGLAGYTGEVYVHAGVITNLSSDGSDWKYVVTAWGENTEATHLTRIETNVYELEITPSIREYYGVPESETIQQMAFVFRSEEQVDGEWLTGKTESGGDIFVNVYETGLNLTVLSPDIQSIFLVGQNVEAHATATPVGTGDVTLFEVLVDDIVVGSSNNNEVSVTFQFDAPGNHTITFSADNGTYQEDVTINSYVLDEQVYADLPVGVIDGINYIDNSTVTLVLHAPLKDFTLLIGDFNNWELTGDYLMNKTPDNERYWLTLTDLDPDVEYRFQYYVDGEIKIADPYTNKILDPWNDHSIPNSIYPDLIEYPDEFTDEIVSVFQINQEEFEWEVTDFQAPEVEDLVIYELLIRDFSENSDVSSVLTKLDYLEELGVNAIELMPFNEFEGNNSWGYNPSFYFATDKAYGTDHDYKTLIDECHKRGIAVIMDMVLNHSFGQSPFLRLYMNNWHPTAENPWYNVDCPHQPWCWGADFNHESQLVKDLVDRVNSHWLSEFKVDGFRFDFTKGFTNTVGDGWAYDASRIAILKRMADEIWNVNDDAYVILEHFTENSEEEELSNYGMLLWGNLNYNYNEATMGWHDSNGKSDFSWISYQKRGWNDPHVIGYMESHDEERLMFKNTEYGNSSGDYNIHHWWTGLKRVELAASFFFTVPGPKMIWQFGELGYDYSINHCEDGTINEDCRTHPKPVRWDYYDENERLRLYQVFSALIDLRKNNEAFNTNDFTMHTANETKSIKLNHSTMDVNILGNFDVVSKSMNPEFQHTGYWYEFFTGDSINIENTDELIDFDPGEYRIYTTVKLDKPDIVANSFETEELDFSYSIYPNPSNDRFYIDLGENIDIQSIQIFNSLGQSIQDISISANRNVYMWNANNFNTGLYYVKVIMNNKEITEKLIKY